MRKGTSHVDWAISMGIFLVYVLLTFIFLKPASESVYSENTLLETVYTGLKGDASYTIKKGYLIITPTNDIVETKEYILRMRCLDVYGTSCLSASGMEMDWVNGKVEDGKESEKYGYPHLTLVNGSLGKVCCENMTILPFDFTDESIPSGSSRNWHILELKTKLKKNEENIFWFLYSKDINYTSHPPVTTGPSSAPCPANPNGWTDCECVKRDLNGNKVNDCLLADGEIIPSDFPDKTNFTYQFGVVESQTAFSEIKLSKLKEEYDNQYKTLKTKWGFPNEKNFNITVTSLISPPLPAQPLPGVGNACVFTDRGYNPKDDNGIIITPPPNVNIFVKEEKAWMMGEQSDLIPISVRIEVW